MYKKNRYKTFCFVYTIVFMLILLGICFNFAFVNNAKAGTLGDSTQYSTWTSVSWWTSGAVKNERERASRVTATEDCVLFYGLCYLKRVEANEEAKMGFYDNSGNLLEVSNELTISSTTGAWYNFTFAGTTELTNGNNYYLCVYADAPNSYPGSAKNYVQIVYNDGVGTFYYQSVNNYPTFSDPASWSSYAATYSMYLQYRVISPWNNTCPVNGNPSIVNHSSNVAFNVGFWNVTISDIDANTTDGTIVCSNGNNMNWSSQTNGTRSLSLNYLNYGTNYTVWLNYSDAFCNVYKTFWFIVESLPFTIYNNTVNTTNGYVLLGNAVDGWILYLNYTGIGGISPGNCTGYCNFSYNDMNISLNVSVNKNNCSHTVGYKVNETSWLFMAGTLLFDNTQVFIFMLLMLWTYFISKAYETRLKLFVLGQFAISIPLFIVVGVLSFGFPYGFLVVFIIPCISIMILYDVYFKGGKKKE